MFCVHYRRKWEKRKAVKFACMQGKKCFASEEWKLQKFPSVVRKTVEKLFRICDFAVEILLTMKTIKCILNNDIMCT